MCVGGSQGSKLKPEVVGSCLKSTLGQGREAPNSLCSWLLEATCSPRDSQLAEGVQLGEACPSLVCRVVVTSGICMTFE